LRSGSAAEDDLNEALVSVNTNTLDAVSAAFRLIPRAFQSSANRHCRPACRHILYL